jgi:hypothetical protein
MGLWQLIHQDNGIRITRPTGDIEVYVRKIGGTASHRTGSIEIRGSRLIPDGALVVLTQERHLHLADDITIKVSSYHRTSSNKLPVYIEKPPEYKTYRIFTRKTT